MKKIADTAYRRVASQKSPRMHSDQFARSRSARSLISDIKRGQMLEAEGPRPKFWHRGLNLSVTHSFHS